MSAILVLEDEPLVMNLFRSVLSRDGYPLLEAVSAGQAMERYAESKRDIALIIADVAPPCSGITVSLQMKTSFPSLKIILTSGYPPDLWPAEQAGLLNGLSLDAINVLLKPFAARDLLKLVSGLIGRPTPMGAAFS